MKGERGGIKFLLALLLAVLGGVGYLVHRAESDPQLALLLKFFERKDPKIELISPPEGLGGEGTEFSLRLTDDGVGLDEVIVRVEQGGDQHEVFRKRYQDGPLEDTVKFRINGKQIKLTEGAFQLSVKLFDRSFWSNGGKLNQDFPIDYERPKIEIVSVQHNAVIGGSELLFYRVRDHDLAASGVVAGGEKFLGRPASELDPDFANTEDLFFTLFAIPPTFDPTQDEVRAFARDRVGNRLFKEFYYKAQRVRGALKERDIGTTFSDAQLTRVAGADGGRREQFQRIVKEIQPETERKIREVLSSVSHDKKLELPFIRPPLTVRNEFSDLKRYLFQGEELALQLSKGTDLLGGGSAPAIGSGRVVFAGPLGELGQTVILSHGAGLSSVYGYLSKIATKEGEDVVAGSSLGTVGRSGLAESGEMLHLEVRVQGVPVRTIEWLDKRWVADHITAKVSEIKETIGIVSEVKTEG